MTILADLRRIREQLEELTRTVKDALEDNRYADMEIRDAILDCLRDGEWRPTKRIKRALWNGGSPHGDQVIGGNLRSMADTGQLERRAQGSAWEYRRIGP